MSEDVTTNPVDAVVPPMVSEETPVEPTVQPVVEPVSEPTPEARPEPTVEPMPQIVEVSERVVFEGQHVTAVLQDGKELRDSAGQITHYHASMEDGTTKHVPVTLFK